MKKLTLRPRLGIKSVESIEKIVNEKFSEQFTNFLIENAGLSHLECEFKDDKGQIWIVHQYNNYKDLYGLTEEFLRVYNRKMIPFAYDSGGWHFCMCLDKEFLGNIFIHRWTDHDINDRFLKIANSFEEFIDGLQPESTQA